MSEDAWHTLLVVTLALNAVAGFGYRVYRLSKGGPMSDVIGQGVLGLVLGGLSLAVASGAGWSRWIALGYGLLFGAIVMPIWVLAVLIPLRPRAVDLGFTALYWAALAVIVPAAVFAS